MPCLDIYSAMFRALSMDTRDAISTGDNGQAQGQSQIAGVGSSNEASYPAAFDGPFPTGEGKGKWGTRCRLPQNIERVFRLFDGPPIASHEM